MDRFKIVCAYHYTNDKRAEIYQLGNLEDAISFFNRLVEIRVGDKTSASCPVFLFDGVTCIASHWVM